jgi:hypothetical protein
MLRIEQGLLASMRPSLFSDGNTPLAKPFVVSALHPPLRAGAVERGVVPAAEDASAALTCLFLQ